MFGCEFVSSCPQMVHRWLDTIEIEKCNGKHESEVIEEKKSEEKVKLYWWRFRYRWQKQSSKYMIKRMIRTTKWVRVTTNSLEQVKKRRLMCMETQVQVVYTRKWVAKRISDLEFWNNHHRRMKIELIICQRGNQVRQESARHRLEKINLS